jgi:hypothetical protein
MAKLQLAALWSSPEWAERSAKGSDALEELIERVSREASENGDEDDIYEAHYLRFLWLVESRLDQRAIIEAEELAGRRPSDSTFVWIIAGTLFEHHKRPDLALLHVQAGLDALDRETDAAARYLSAIRLRTLQLVCTADLDPKSPNLPRIQGEMMFLAGCRQMYNPLLLEAMKIVDNSGGLVWASASILNAMWSDLAYRRKYGDPVEKEMAEIDSLLQRVPPLDFGDMESQDAEK